jgi:hypothetical protein
VALPNVADGTPLAVSLFTMRRPYNVGDTVPRYAEGQLVAEKNTKLPSGKSTPVGWAVAPAKQTNARLCGNVLLASATLPVTAALGLGSA